VELREHIIFNYPGWPHIAAAIWPCIGLFIYLLTT